MQSHYFLDVLLSQLGHRHSQVHCPEISTLGQSVDHHPYCIMTFKGSWQMGHKIHSCAIPFSHRYVQRLLSSIETFMLYHRLLTFQTGGYKLSHILLHALPLKGLLKILVHLSHARMQAKTTLVSFIKDQPLHLSIFRYTHPASESQYTVITQGKLLSFI